MAGVYTTRFLHGAGLDHVSWQCPPGKRAVVKCISLASLSDDAKSAFVTVGGIIACSASVPGLWANRIFEGTWVAYALETITMTSVDANLHCHVTGYLFDDPGTRAVGGILAAAPDQAQAPDATGRPA